MATPNPPDRTHRHRSPKPRLKRAHDDHVLDIYEVSARTGHSPDRIRHLRVSGHELYDKAWKNGDAPSSPLLWDESDVEEWVDRQKVKTVRDRP